MSPISTIKSNVSVSKIIGFVILSVVVFAILDATGVTDWVLYPYRNLNKLTGGKLPGPGKA